MLIEQLPDHDHRNKDGLSLPQAIAFDIVVYRNCVCEHNSVADHLKDKVTQAANTVKKILEEEYIDFQKRFYSLLKQFNTLSRDVFSLYRASISRARPSSQDSLLEARHDAISHGVCGLQDSIAKFIDNKDEAWEGDFNRFANSVISELHAIIMYPSSVAFTIILTPLVETLWFCVKIQNAISKRAAPFLKELQKLMQSRSTVWKGKPEDGLRKLGNWWWQVATVNRKPEKTQRLYPFKFALNINQAPQTTGQPGGSNAAKTQHKKQQRKINSLPRVASPTKNQTTSPKRGGKVLDGSKTSVTPGNEAASHNGTKALSDISYDAESETTSETISETASDNTSEGATGKTNGKGQKKKKKKPKSKTLPITPKASQTATSSETTSPEVQPQNIPQDTSWTTVTSSKNTNPNVQSKNIKQNPQPISTSSKAAKSFQTTSPSLPISTTSETRPSETSWAEIASYRSIPPETPMYPRTPEVESAEKAATATRTAKFKAAMELKDAEAKLHEAKMAVMAAKTLELAKAAEERKAKEALESAKALEAKEAEKVKKAAETKREKVVAEMKAELELKAAQAKKEKEAQDAQKAAEAKKVANAMKSPKDWPVFIPARSKVTAAPRNNPIPKEN
jgi:hypothetical protein